MFHIGDEPSFFCAVLSSSSTSLTEQTAILLHPPKYRQQEGNKMILFRVHLSYEQVNAVRIYSSLEL